MRQAGWIRGSVLGPAFLIVGFMIIFAVGYHLTGNFDVDHQQHDAHTGAEISRSSTVAQRIWATLGMFRGSYIALSPDWDPMPPPELSVVGIIAPLFTLVTASSLLVLLSRKARDFIRTLRPTPSLVVIGDGATAAALIKSSIDRNLSTFLITDSRTSEATRATTPMTPVIASGQIEGALATPSARRVMRNAAHVAIATDSDGLNMQLLAIVHRIRDGASGDAAASVSTTARPAPRDLVVIHDPDYAELLRPRVIPRELPPYEATCPADNLAEHITHLIVAAITGSNRVFAATVEIVDTDATDHVRGSVAPRIETWALRLAASLSRVRGAQVSADPDEYERVPKLFIAGNVDHQTASERTIRIIAGRTPSAVATQALTQEKPTDITIAVADTQLLTGAAEQQRMTVRTGRHWLELGAPLSEGLPVYLVVDPEKEGLDAGLVTDDTGTQWARTFNLTYELMWSGGKYPVVGWQPGAPMGAATRSEENKHIALQREKNGKLSPKQKDDAAARARKEIGNRYSSKKAAENMLRFLADRGFELRRPLAGEEMRYAELGKDDVEFIADAEHTDWLTRTWVDTSRTPNREITISDYSSAKLNRFCYQGLTQFEKYPELLKLEQYKADSDALRFAANYNRRIVQETYPAIAASFGYSIVAADGPPPQTLGSGDSGDKTCERSTCPCRMTFPNAGRGSS